MPKKSMWDEIRLKSLADLWAEGYSASQIAIQLTDSFGVEFTRNAVIGAAHRSNLAGRPSPIGGIHYAKGGRHKVALPKPPAPKPRTPRAPRIDDATLNDRAGQYLADQAAKEQRSAQQPKAARHVRRPHSHKQPPAPPTNIQGKSALVTAPWNTAPSATVPKPGRLPDEHGPVGQHTLAEAQQRHGCVWPSGDLPGMTFCGGARSVAADPYCDMHRALEDARCRKQARKRVVELERAVARRDKRRSAMEKY